MDDETLKYKIEKYEFKYNELLKKIQGGERNDLEIMGENGENEQIMHENEEYGKMGLIMHEKTKYEEDEEYEEKNDVKTDSQEGGFFLQVGDRVKIKNTNIVGVIISTNYYNGLPFITIRGDDRRIYEKPMIYYTKLSRNYGPRIILDPRFSPRLFPRFRIGDIVDHIRGNTNININGRIIRIRSFEFNKPLLYVVRFYKSGYGSYDLNLFENELKLYIPSNNVFRQRQNLQRKFKVGDLVREIQSRNVGNIIKIDNDNIHAVVKCNNNKYYYKMSKLQKINR